MYFERWCDVSAKYNLALVRY